MISPVPKPKKRKRVKSGPIPEHIFLRVRERDNDTCQLCGYQGRGLEPHHIILAGKGKRKIHAVENILLLCGNFNENQCHKKMHEGSKDPKTGEWISQKEYQEWTIDWSRSLYGDTIDRIKDVTVKGRKWRG